MDPLAQLHALPSIESALASYTAMEAEIRDAVTAASPTTVWALEVPESRGGCSKPFDTLGGRSVSLVSYGSYTPIPDAAWPTAYAAASAIARRYGFAQCAFKVDGPGNHQVRFTNPADGAYSDLGTVLAATLLTDTGCHLPEQP